jgi:hypothetical protein
MAPRLSSDTSSDVRRLIWRWRVFSKNLLSLDMSSEQSNYDSSDHPTLDPTLKISLHLMSVHPKTFCIAPTRCNSRMLVHLSRWFFLSLVQIVLAVIWTPLDFHYNLGTLTAIWTLDCNLDCLVYKLDSVYRIYKSYKCNLTNLLVPLTILSHNHRNHNYDLMGPCFLRIHWGATSNKMSIATQLKAQCIVFELLWFSLTSLS